MHFRLRVGRRADARAVASIRCGAQVTTALFPFLGLEQLQEFLDLLDAIASASQCNGNIRWRVGRRANARTTLLPFHLNLANVAFRLKIC